MKDLFDTLYQHSFPEGLIWRETSAQHFQNSGGEYSLPTYGKPCRAISPEDSVYGWREPIVRQAAIDANFRVGTADVSLLQTSTETDEIDFFIAPFANFTRDLHDLHNTNSKDCTHYCHTPIWSTPLWRSVRLAIDYKLR